MAALARVALAVCLLTACSVGSSASSPTSRTATGPSTPSQVYVALGASETAGVGTVDPAREAFPQQLMARLGGNTVLYDLGIPAETTAQALNDELPEALAVKPTVATVFFSVDDLVAGISPVDFRARLDRILSALSASGGVRVLVANTPSLDQLPAAAACQAGSVACPLKGVIVPPIAQVRALVQVYNVTIAEAVAAHGARLIDLSRAGLIVSEHPEYVSADGFHPSRLGAAALADAFYAALTAKP